MDEELKKKWIDICERAPYYKGVSDCGNHIVPDWFDNKKFIPTL